MDNTFVFNMDGKEVKAEKGQTIMEAADKAGIYIPRLCQSSELKPHGSCRVCSVKVNGRFQAACTQPAEPNIEVECETEEINKHRMTIVEMLFVEGNHFCPSCEKSGNCELQALAYKLGMMAPSMPYLFPDRKLDASHPEIFIDRNRCILCGRCVEASKTEDGKNVFGFVGRGLDKQIAVNSDIGLAGTNMKATDKAASVCPVGCILVKKVGFKVPVGQRKFDNKPIGSEIEAGGK